MKYAPEKIEFPISANLEQKKRWLNVIMNAITLEVDFDRGYLDECSVFQLNNLGKLYEKAVSVLNLNITADDVAELTETKNNVVMFPSTR